MCKKLSMLPRRMSLPLLMTLALSACATEPAPPAVIVKDSACRVFRSISWGLADTKETITQVRSHNAKLWNLCPRKKT